MEQPWAAVSLYFDTGLNPEWAHVYACDGAEGVVSDRVEVGAFNDSQEVLAACTRRVADAYIELGVWS